MLIVPLLNRLKPMIEKAATFREEFPDIPLAKGYREAVEDLLIVLDDYTTELEIKKEVLADEQQKRSM